MFNLSSPANGASSRLYPAEPGILTSSSPRKERELCQWAQAEKLLSSGQALSGLLLILLSFTYLHEFTSFTGILLGGLLLAAGALGFVGGYKWSPNLVNAHLVTSLLVAFLAFQLAGSVLRDTDVDCSLAQLYLQGRATARLAEEARSAEALQAVFLRLDELDDSISLAQQGAVKQMQLAKAQEELKYDDLSFIDSKMDLVRAHAEQLLNSVVNNPDITATTVQGMGEEDKARLKRRLELADQVLERVKKAQEGGQHLSHEDFEQVLEALTNPEAFKGHSVLEETKAQLPHLKAALERARADEYHNLDPLGIYHTHIEPVDKQLKQRRDQFANDFKSLLQKQMAAGEEDYLVDLPEQCLQEGKAQNWVVVLVALVVALELGSAYTALSLGFRLNSLKAE